MSEPELASLSAHSKPEGEEGTGQWSALAPRALAEDIVVALEYAKSEEPTESRADRYERTLRAIATCPLTGSDFGDWVQSACEDALMGLSPECWNCGTAVHDGPCVSEEPTS